MCERKSLRPQGLARTTAEGARGCAWRAAGRRCRGCRHADVSRHRTQPYRTVPYHTVSYLTAGTYGKAYLTLSLSKKARGKESRCWKPAKMWKTLWKACGKLVSRRSGRAWSGAGAAEHGGVPTGGTCGCGRGFWSGTVRRVLSAGAGVVDAFGWRVVAAVRCWTRVQRRARWLAFLPREKMLDKLCKSILNWKQGITQAAAGDGLRHRPHRRSCSVYPTSTSSVAAWPPRHLPRIAKGDARSHPRRALPPSGSPAGVRIPRPPHPSRRLRSCAVRPTRAFPALPSAKRRRKTPPRIEPMLGGVL